MTSVAVVAHARKRLGGGLTELRTVLSAEGVTDPLWYEVPKSKKVAEPLRDALEKGADLVILWGGDGMVQRSVDVLAGTNVTIGIVPAGTANLLATNLGIPQDIPQAVRIALHGARRRLDLGTLNGERFAVMAGAGFDALMIRDVSRGMKERVGQLAYIWAGARHLSEPAARVRIKVDGTKWFEGEASCVLVANVGKIIGGIAAFKEARPDDGRLELGVVTATGLADWARTMGRAAVGQPDRSPFVQTTSGREFDVKSDRKLVCEVDGGDRKPTKRFRIQIEPGAVEIAVPEPSEERSEGEQR